MARKGRIEFAGALYHVLDRGDRREPIVRSDGDRAAFVRTLGEASLRAGWRMHAFVLMGNHYHLLLETPQPNLVAGMRWFQTGGRCASIVFIGLALDCRSAALGACEPGKSLLGSRGRVS